jgi:hypothetical protein
MKGRSGGLAQAIDAFESLWRPTASQARHDVEVRNELRVEVASPDDAFLGRHFITIRRKRRPPTPRG